MNKIYIFRFLLTSFVISCFSFFTIAQNQKHLPLDMESKLTTIAFGSCNKQDEKQDMWEYIARDHPDVWLWTGDIIYADTEDMQYKKEQYQVLKENLAYKKFISKIPVIGTWDDHDYGDNDACKTYPKREESKQLILDFLDVDKSSPIHERQGIYQAYTLGSEDQSVKIIVLDTRYFKDELKKNPVKDANRYIPDSSADILGKEQWTWLEQQLTESSAKVHIIVTSIQLIPKEHYFEKWNDCPAARQRFFDLLKKTKPSNTVLISGDRHIAEISVIDIDGMKQPIYEVTSSGLTHTWSKYREEPNEYRVGDLIAKLNYGLIHIDWSSGSPKLTAEIKGTSGNSYQLCQLE